ncbi:hypothetical protein HDZ31DRAFT_61667 [Schizophyllum fasciatum]
MSSAITYKLPLLLYQAFLIRMPVFYYGRVARVLEDAELSLADVKKLAFTTASDWRNKDDQQREEALYQLNHFGNWSSTPQYAAQVTPAMRRFRGSWESFIDALIQEWKTQNVISALLLSPSLVAPPPSYAQLRLYDISSKEPIYSQILGSAPSEAAGAIAVFSELQVWNERYLCQRGMAAVLTQEHRRGTVGHYVYLVDIQDGPLLNALVLNETFKHRLSPAPIERVCLYLFDRHPPLPPAGERVDTHVMIDMETLTIRWPASGVDWLAELPAHPIALSLVKVHLSPSSARSLSVTRLRPSFGSSEPPGPQSAPMGDSFVSDGPSTRSPEHGRAPHVGSQAATQTAHTNLPVIDILTDSSPESIVGDLGGDFLVHQAHRGESATAAGGPVSPVARPHNTLGPDCNCDWCGT